MAAQQPPMQGGLPIPGQQPTPEQLQALQRRIAEDAAKAGMSVPDFIEEIKRQRMAAMQAQQQQHQHSHENGEGHDHDHDQEHAHDHGDGHSHTHPHQQQQAQPQAITPGPPNPKALALAQFMRGQDLKPRTVILNGERKEMFRGKSAPPPHVHAVLRFKYSNAKK